MNLKPLIASTAVAAVLAGGALASATVGLFSPARDDAVQLVPSTAFIYGNVFLDPSAPQKLALEDLIARFPKASTPEQAKAAITRGLDEGLKEIGMNFATDVEPWLGSQVAFFMMSPGGMPATPPGGSTSSDPGAALLIASEDPVATQAALDKALASGAADSEPTSPASYNGIDYSVSSEGGEAVGVIDDFLVFGTEAGFKAAADARAGDSLGDSDVYEDAVADLTEDRLATFYMDPSKALPSGLPPGMVPSAFGSTGPLVSILYARSDAIVFEASLPAGAASLLPAGGTDLIEALPGDTWAAFGIPSFGQTLQQTIGQVMGAMPGAPPGAGIQMLEGQLEMQFGLSLQEDLLSWLGDVAFFARGSSVESIGGGVVIRATDPARAADAMPKIEAALQRSGAPVKPLDLGQFDGFSIQDKAMPEAINFVLADERVLIVYGRDATLAALGTDPSLAGNETFGAAKAGLGEGFAVAGYMDFQSIVALFEDQASSDPVYDNDVKPFLDRFSFVVFGSRTEGDRLVTRAVIGVR